MANNLRKFNTYSDYQSAELVKPAVSLIAATDEVYFDQKDAPVPPTPTFSGLTVYYDITDTSQPTTLFKGGGSGSGSGSGSGGALPSAMIIDGTAVEVTNAYPFSTTGEHIVNYSFADNKIPRDFLYGGSQHIFNNVVKIIIGDAITSIDGGAFIECYGLTSVTIGSGITAIDDVFQNCTSLTNITIPNSVTSIGNNAFNNCTSLTNITIPDSVTSIDANAFSNCTSLTSCTIGSGVTTIGQAVFQFCSSLTSIDIPDSVTSIGGYAFGYCSSLTSVTISNSVTSLGSGVFQSCSGLTSVTIPSGVTSIGGNAFDSCSSLTSITIPNSVTSLGSGVFQSCSGLTSVTIPSGVTSIGTQAFQNCASLTSIVSNATTAPTIKSWTFYNVKTGGTLTVPSGSSGYDVWMQNANYYLGLYGWTKVEQ